MNTRQLTLCVALALPMWITGCASTPHHKEVRSEASERMEFVHAQMAYDQGKQAYETGQFAKALKQVDMAVARFPDQPHYHVLRGRIFLETHNLEAAFESFAEAMAINDDLAEPYYFTGIVQQRWSRLNEAADAYQGAFQRDPSKVQYLLASAEALVAEGRYQEAKDLITERLRQFEHNAALRQLLGEIAMLEGDPSTAAKLLGDARLMNPDDPMLLEELARAQFAAREFAKAHHSVKRLQELVENERPDVLHLEARCLVMIERTNEARNVYLQLSEQSPTDPVIWIELGNVALEVGDLRRVALCSSRIIALAPDRFEGYLLKGLYERSQGNLDNAIAALSDAAGRAGDNAWPHVLLGVALEEAGMGDGAMRAYETALAIDPTHVGAQAQYQGLLSGYASQPELDGR